MLLEIVIVGTNALTKPKKKSVTKQCLIIINILYHYIERDSEQQSKMQNDKKKRQEKNKERIWIVKRHVIPVQRPDEKS